MLQLPDASRKNVCHYDEIASGPNVYAYVDGDPINNTDPEGLRGAQPAIPSIRFPPQNPFRDPVKSQRELTESIRRCRDGNCSPQDIPRTGQSGKICFWECPQNPLQCTQGDPNPQNQTWGLGNLLPPQGGCVWTCKPGPQVTSGR